MKYSLMLAMGLVMIGSSWAMAVESPEMPADPPAAKELSGMSIVGNDEAPKSLYIIPWKSSELGAGTSLNRMISERDVPVDREVFMRELRFYEVSTVR